MPNGGQTLDQIFSAKAPVSPTATASTGNAPSQSLESIFGNSQNQASNRPSLDSIFSAKPPAPITGNDIFDGTPEAAKAREATDVSVTKDIIPNIENDFNDRIQQKNQTEQDYADGKIGLGHAVFQSIGNVIGGAFDIPKDIIKPYLDKTIGTDTEKSISDSVGGEIDKISAPLADALAKPEVATMQNAGALYKKAGDLYQQAHAEPDPTKQQRLIQLAEQTTKAADAVKSTANDMVNSQSSAGRDASATVNIGTLGMGGAAPEDTIANLSKAGNEAKNIASDAATLTGKATAPVRDALGNIIDKTGQVASDIKDKIAPTPTIDQIVGQVAQGGSEDVGKFTTGLKNLDTSSVKTYEDLNKVSSDTIKTEAKAQDTALTQNAEPLKVQQLAIKVGDQAAAHNYVIDAVNQLKDYFSKTNDIANLAKVNGYIEKLDPIKGKGLTVKEVNDIARMHGTNLNGYNANGELASGLTKQAAENTRIGLKNTVVQNIKDPAMQAAFKASDAKMSSLYTVRDLSGKMADKVNTLSQRLQKPNILQKIGSIIGKVGRISGVGDIAQKLLGIEKVPGASTLNAVELEAKLSSNLKKINDALKKDDNGFVKDIQGMIQDGENNATTKSTPKSDTNITTNQKANAGDNAQSIRNNSNQAISKDSTTFTPKSKTGQLIQNAIKQYQETPNKQGGFAKIPSSIRDIADTQRDDVLSRLNKLDSKDFVNSKGNWNMEAIEKYDEIMARFEKGNDTPEDIRTANELLALMKK